MQTVLFQEFAKLMDGLMSSIPTFEDVCQLEAGQVPDGFNALRTAYVHGPCRQVAFNNLRRKNVVYVGPAPFRIEFQLVTDSLQQSLQCLYGLSVVEKKCNLRRVLTCLFPLLFPSRKCDAMHSAVVFGGHDPNEDVSAEHHLDGCANPACVSFSVHDHTQLSICLMRSWQM